MTDSPSSSPVFALFSLRSPARVALVLLMTGALSACASSGAANGDAPPPADRPTVDRTVIQGVESGGAVLATYSRPDGTERIIGAELAFVWAVMPAVLRVLDIPLAHSDPRVHEIGNRGYRARRIGGDRLAKFFRCGENMIGSRTNEYEITLSVITSLREAPDGETGLVTTVDARGRQRATSAVNIACETTGALEEMIADETRKQVALRISGGV